jgi:hypothetical protein
MADFGPKNACFCPENGGFSPKSAPKMAELAAFLRSFLLFRYYVDFAIN